MRGRTAADVAEHYDHEVELADAAGAGLIWFLGGDQLSPPLDNADEFALDFTRWRDAVALRVARLAEQMGIQAGGRVLDLGCGIGGPAREIERRTGCEVHGVTLSAKQAVRVPRARLGDMQALDEPDASFDHVYSVNAIYHAGDFQAVIAEAARVLRRGGRFGVDDWFTTARTDPVTHARLRHAWSTEDRGFHDVDRFVDSMREHGLRILESVDYTAEAGAFLSEARFGSIYDAQAAPVLLRGFRQLWPDYEPRHAIEAVQDLRRDVLFMGELYRDGRAAYRQIVAEKA
jgi:ubiquinone/menaquinone biosynthesis C-methylase UbiE